MESIFKQIKIGRAKKRIIICGVRQPYTRMQRIWSFCYHHTTINAQQKRSKTCIQLDKGSRLTLVYTQTKKHKMKNGFSFKLTYKTYYIHIYSLIITHYVVTALTTDPPYSMCYSSRWHTNLKKLQYCRTGDSMIPPLDLQHCMSVMRSYSLDCSALKKFVH